MGCIECLASRLRQLAEYVFRLQQKVHAPSVTNAFFYSFTRAQCWDPYLNIWWLDNLRDLRRDAGLCNRSRFGAHGRYILRVAGDFADPFTAENLPASSGFPIPKHPAVMNCHLALFFAKIIGTYKAQSSREIKKLHPSGCVNMTTRPCARHLHTTHLCIGSAMESNLQQQTQARSSKYDKSGISNLAHYTREDDEDV